MVITGVSLGGFVIADREAARNKSRTFADLGRFAGGFSGLIVWISADFERSIGCNLRCSLRRYSFMASVPLFKMYSDGYVKGFPDIRRFLSVGTKPEERVI